MSYQSVYTGQEIDNGISINAIQNNKLTDLENMDMIQNNKLTDLENMDMIQNKKFEDLETKINKIVPFGLYKGTLIASNWTVEMSNLEDYSNMANKWKWEKFSSHKIDSNIRQTLLSAAPNTINYILDSNISSAINKGDNYTARCTIYIYCPNQIDYSCIIQTDDDGAVYINGTFITTTVSCKNTSITIPFQKGANCLEVFYTDGTGEDGWKFSPAMNSRIGNEFSAMYAVPAHEYCYQTITPIKIGGPDINSNFIFSPGTIKNDLSLINERDKINSGIIIPNDDKTITIKYNHTIPINSDITLYWFGVEDKS